MFDTSTQNFHDKRVAIWLLSVCALVFAMIILGGVTRLTGSGLSMVDWKPITGVLPPLNETDWQRLFEQYKSSPEYEKVNSHFDVVEFKKIFWLEYLHRVLGRIIGLAFALPFLIFAVKGYIARRHWPRYLLMFVLGGMQGLLGWYMVKSGLVDVPHVSQYRLTAHLIAAFAIYAYMFWVAMSLLYPVDDTRKQSRHPWFGRTVALTGLIGITIVSGGFVAGLDAGKIYNSFPLMGESLIPPGLLAIDPIWRNFFENTTTVQFDHRLLAIGTLISIIAYRIFARGAIFPARALRAADAMLYTAILQVVLGVSTLLLSVPLVLGAAHQATAIVLFTFALYLIHSLRDASTR